jgi:hypothetical protein
MADRGTARHDAADEENQVRSGQQRNEKENQEEQ